LAGLGPKSLAAKISQIDRGLVDINTELYDGAAAGTGMVVSSSGEVITNNHVVEGASTITAVDLGTGRTYTAHLVGYDRSGDIAVLQLDGASGLPTVPLGNSSNVHAGAKIVTLGNAGGIGGTPSAAGGSVTATGQSIIASDSVSSSDEKLSGLIQINGQLQPGDSGGPLVGGSGVVVGMDTAASVAFDFQQGADQGFAIPIDKVTQIAGQIVAGHGSNLVHVGNSAMLGILVGAATVPGTGGDTGTGVKVEQTLPNTPASTAGLTAGDTITALNGITVNGSEALVTAMDRFHPGETVRLAWTDRAGGAHSGKLRLATGPAG
jgi:S1-C subfamily serine protease